MKILDGHSHLFQPWVSASELKKSVQEIEGWDRTLLLKRLDEIGVSQVQTMPQEMTRVQGHWLGSNELSADIRRCAPARMVAFRVLSSLTYVRFSQQLSLKVCSNLAFG